MVLNALKFSQVLQIVLVCLVRLSLSILCGDRGMKDTYTDVIPAQSEMLEHSIYIYYIYHCQWLS